MSLWQIIFKNFLYMLSVVWFCHLCADVSCVPEAHLDRCKPNSINSSNMMYVDMNIKNQNRKTDLCNLFCN